jgi:hypothetical protein
MRFMLVLALAAVSAVAQSPRVQFTNISRPGSKDFQVGDRFEIAITGAANQPISLRTTMQSQTDWGPVIGWTDVRGRWSTSGQFQNSDFGGWREVWTVADRLASPVVDFSVGAPCLQDGRGLVMRMSLAMVQTCETAQGSQTFRTRSGNESFRTPDGRVVPGRMRADMTAEQYHAEVMQSFITGGVRDARPGRPGDEAGALIAKIIGTNALDERETRNVLAIVHAAFEHRDRIPETAKNPAATLRLLRNLAQATEQEGLKREIAETVAYVQAQ